MEIPEKIKSKAHSLGWSGVEYIGENAGRLFYVRPPAIDEHGKILPTGLPELLILARGKVRRVQGISALELLRLFN